MEQYLDKKDNKWHITFWFDMPRVIIKNKLNFRIKEVVLDDGSIINDPNLNDSSYIFSIPESMLGKNIFFNFSFLQEEISKISEFRIGLCDEKVRWFNNNIDIKNDFIENKEALTENKIDILNNNHIDLDKDSIIENNIEKQSFKDEIENISNEVINTVFLPENKKENIIDLENKQRPTNSKNKTKKYKNR